MLQVTINFLSCQIDNFYSTIGIVYSFIWAGEGGIGLKGRRKNTG